MERAKPRGADQLLTVPEAAARLAVSRSTLYLLMDQGQLAYVKVRGARRVAEADVRRYQERNRVGAG